MAGIGFELKKLFRQKGYFQNIKAYTFSTVVTIGPLILNLILILSVQEVLRYLHAPLKDRELFLGAVQYAFIFSQIVTSGFVMILYRYIADCIYLKKYDDILSSLHGAVFISLIFGGLIGVVFYIFSPLDIAFKIWAYLLYAQLIVIWVQTVYLSALKDYLRITKRFAIGVLSAVISIGVSYKVFYTTGAAAMLICINIGFFVIMILFLNDIKQFFKVNNRKYLQFLSYIDKYPALFGIGMYYTVGLYIHNFIYWGSSIGEVIEHTYYLAPYYDIPVFYALMSIVPAMVVFVVSVETSFYDKYRGYYHSILGGGTWNDIESGKKSMFQTLMVELSHIMQVQLMFTIVSMVLASILFPRIGLTDLQIKSFFMLALGAYSIIIMYLVVLVLLYFDDRKGAVWITGFFFTTNTLFSFLLVETGSFGLSFFISSFLSMISAYIRLYFTLKNVDYNTYLSQPIVIKEDRAGVFTRLVNVLYK